MVETSSLSQNEIDSMMKRIHSVPIIETLQMEILRLDEGECERSCSSCQEVGWNLRDISRWFTRNNCRYRNLLGDSTDWFEAKVATTDFNIRFLRPCNTDVRCVARVIKAGRTMSLSEAELYDSENNLVAVAQVNYIKLD